MSSISKADSDEKIGEFWDTHDFNEFDTDAPDAEFEIISNHYAESVKCNSPGQRPGIRFPKNILALKGRNNFSQWALLQKSFPRVRGS